MSLRTLAKEIHEAALDSNHPSGSNCYELIASLDGSSSDVSTYQSCEVTSQAFEKSDRLDESGRFAVPLSGKSFCLTGRYYTNPRSA